MLIKLWYFYFNQDIVDPDKVFKHRFYQDSCDKIVLEEEQIDDFVKDMGRLNRDLKRLIYIDCKAFTFWVNPNNGILYLFLQLFLFQIFMQTILKGMMVYKC